MKIQRNNGYIATITLDNYFDTEEESNLRDIFFRNAIVKSCITPLNRLDNYDETILVFNDSTDALMFLTCLFKEALTEDILSNSINLRAGLYAGEYFSYQNQIYGDAVNYATKLSYSSRQNEILVCGINQEIIVNLVDYRSDIRYVPRKMEDQCFSISLIDDEVTCVTIENLIFNVKYSNQRKKLQLSRNRKISIGRSDEADVSIDDFHISRNHATITFHDDKIFIEDHSSNGTYVYIDGEEKFIANDTISITGEGYILCGQKQSALSARDQSENIISFRLSKERA